MSDFDVQCRSMNIVQLNQVPSQPWRNGGGHTRQLLAWPQAQDWQLRVSVATIQHSGAFSVFAGVQRWFAVIDGTGVSLDLPNGSFTQTPADPPLCFDGEAAPMCHLLDGPTTDLNLMQRRGSGTAQMQHAHAGDTGPVATRWRGIYVAAEAVLDINDVAQPLHAHSLCWSDEVDTSTWRLRSLAHNGLAWWLQVQAP
jgi:uncharacterized protein